MNSQDLEALKALAEKATPGEWRWMQREDHAVKLLSTVKAITGENDIVMVRLEGVRPSDRAFIAAFNPQTALALLSHIAALEAEKAEARRLALEQAAKTAKWLLEARANWLETFPNDSECWSDERAPDRLHAAILALKERT